MKYKYITKILILILIMPLVSCSWLKAKVPLSRKTVEAKTIGSIVQLELLHEGGKVLAVPFKAGVNVEATDNLDIVALRIVKGISDAIEQTGVPIEILTSANSDEAKFILQGHIVEMKTSGNMKKFLLRGKDIVLGVEGQMVDKKTKKVVLYFKDRIKAKLRDKSYRVLGQEIGYGIGQFISSGVKK